MKRWIDFLLWPFQSGLKAKWGRPGVLAFPTARKKKKANEQSSLVKARPASLRQSYEMVQDERVLDRVFNRVRSRLFRLGGADEGTEQNLGPQVARPTVRFLRESGRVAPQRAYFYLKPINETGWLFERSGTGWVISRAEKIAAQDTFLRDNEPWDIVSVYQHPDRVGPPRVSSLRYGQDLVSLPVYERFLAGVLEEES